MWCAVCGAYADTTPKLLTLACRDDPEGKPQLRGMLLQKNCLLRNVHPVTKKELPPQYWYKPAPWWRPNGRLEKLQRSSGLRCLHQSSRTTALNSPEPSCGEECQSWLRARPARREDPAKRLRTRRARAALEGCSNKRQIEVFLNAAEVEDSDLIEFWASDPSSSSRQDPTEHGSTAEQLNTESPSVGSMPCHASSPIVGSQLHVDQLNTESPLVGSRRWHALSP